jgi:hypothetical protein
VRVASSRSRWFAHGLGDSRSQDADLRLAQMAAADRTRAGQVHALPVRLHPVATQGVLVSASRDGTAARRLRGWWLAPPRPGLQRAIAPWEYRHLRPFGVARLVGGVVAAAAGVVCLWYGAYAWAAFFLALGALDLGGGYWYLTIAGSAAAREARTGD